MHNQDYVMPLPAAGKKQTKKWTKNVEKVTYLFRYSKFKDSMWTITLKTSTFERNVSMSGFLDHCKKLCLVVRPCWVSDP